MLYKIALIEKPVGTLHVLTFLHQREGSTITNFIASGWNRRTIQQSLKSLIVLGLAKATKDSQFPRFRKVYSLTYLGIYVAKFADMTREACRKFKGLSLIEASRSPKGCMRILVYFSRREWQGICDLLKETGLNAVQAYKCLRWLDRKGIAVLKLQTGRIHRIISCEVAPVASMLSISFDALDGALERALLWQGDSKS